MITEDDIKRINELYHKRQNNIATDEEINEHEMLRKRYIKAMRDNLRASLDNTVIQYPDGSRVKLSDKVKKKE